MITADFDRMNLEDGDLLLDLGAGGGRHSFEGMRRGLRSVAVDLNPSDLSKISSYSGELRSSPEAKQWPPVRPILADARRLPFADDVFDGSICSEVLEHLDEESAVLAELYRTLRPGGLLAVSVPSYFPELVNWAISREYHSAKGGHIRIYTKAELTRFIQNAGFRIIGYDRVHAAHSPYWWLKCLVGVNNSNNRWVNRYESLIVRDMFTPIPWFRRAERTLDPLCGKSQVVFAQKPTSMETVH